MKQPGSQALATPRTKQCRAILKGGALCDQSHYVAAWGPGCHGIATCQIAVADLAAGGPLHSIGVKKAVDELSHCRAHPRDREGL